MSYTTTTTTTTTSPLPIAQAYPVVSLSPTPIAKAMPVTYKNNSNSNSNTTNTYNDSSSHKIKTSLTETQIEALCDQGFTRGLALSLNSMKEVFAMRYWIIDNSSSMRKSDGQRLVVSTGGQQTTMRNVNCSRWEEVRECVEYHIRMSSLIEVPTKFSLLNHPHVGSQQFSIACRSSSDDSSNDAAAAINTTDEQQVHKALDVMKQTRPGGCTPLTGHILEIFYEIQDVVPTLRATGQRIVIVIATDGLPTNERGICNHSTKAQFVEALKKLEELPVWVVIRLSTDEENVVRFYNELDQQIEVDLDLLDDFTSEAREVATHNPWLNYALPLHRLREMGYQQRVMDLLDERPLTKSEVRDYCCLLFGTTGRVDDDDGELNLADPSVDWKQFINDIDRLQQQQEVRMMTMMQYNPIEKKNCQWINTRKLDRIYGNNSHIKLMKIKKWFKN